MRLLGVETVEGLGPQYVSHQALQITVPEILISLSQINTRMTEQQIFDGPSGLESLRRDFRAKL